MTSAFRPSRLAPAPAWDEAERDRRAKWVSRLRVKGIEARMEEAPERKESVPPCPSCAGRRLSLRQHPRGRFGLVRFCLDCHARRARAWRRRNRERQAEYQRRWRAKRKTFTHYIHIDDTSSSAPSTGSVILNEGEACMYLAQPQKPADFPENPSPVAEKRPVQELDSVGRKTARATARDSRSPLAPNPVEVRCRR